MTEFVKTCKRIEEMVASLGSIEEHGHWGGHQLDIDQFREELQGPLNDKVSKFKARIEEPDPNKRTYGAAMEAKVRACLEQYDALLKRFAEVADKVAANHAAFASEQGRHEEEQKRRLAEEEAEKRLHQQEEDRQRQEAERLRLLQLQEAVLQELAQQKEMFLRRQERERASQLQKEVEAWQSIEVVERQERKVIEEELENRRKKEQAREEKRRRLGAILEQHRQVKEKGEQQLIEEAIVMSLRESAPAKCSGAAGSSTSPEPVPTATPMDVDVEEPQEKKPEPMEIPPAADLETEEMLIKQAIELSLQLSAVASHRQSNSRADKAPDTHSP